MKVAVCTGRHQSVCKLTSGVLIPKPGKEDNTQQKAYRSISVLSSMGKVIENVVAVMLSDQAER